MALAWLSGWLRSACGIQSGDPRSRVSPGGLPRGWAILGLVSSSRDLVWVGVLLTPPIDSGGRALAASCLKKFASLFLCDGRSARLVPEPKPARRLLFRLAKLCTVITKKNELEERKGTEQQGQGF